MRSVKISVAGQTLALRTDAKPAYVVELADYVSRAVAEAKASSRVVTTQSAALLAALNIADELLQLRDRHHQLRRQVEQRVARILDHLDREAQAQPDS